MASTLPVHADPVTGVEVARLTTERTIQHHLYFTTPTCTADGSLFLYVSYETGFPNLCCVDTVTGEISRLTYRKDLDPCSGVITWDNQAVLYTARDTVWGTTLLDGRETTVTRFPNSRLGPLSLSPDGRCVALSLTSGGQHQVAEVDLSSGRSRVLLNSPQAIGRVQYDPAGGKLLLTGGDAAGIRVVNRDGTQEHLLYPQVSGEWVTHEIWLSESEVAFVKFHDGLHVMNLAAANEVRAVFKGPIWHAAARRDGRLLACDTHAPDIGLLVLSPRSGKWRVLCYPRSSNKGTQWFEPLPAAASVVDPSEHPKPGAPLDERESAYGPQWTHPHPSFHPDGRRVFFTSDTSGYPQVYCARIPEEWLKELEAY